MKTLRLLPVFLLGILLTVIAQSCISDSFTTSPSDVLSFSTDTLRFDTVFTDLGTPTARLKVYNRASKSISISSIRFRKSPSDFSLNVDGVSGTSFANVEIRPNDSIFVFVECFIDPTDTSRPFLVEDELEFVTNGVEQTVVVEAYGQNVTRLRAETLTADATFTAERPYVVYDSLVVAPGAVLRLEPDTRLLFHDKARLVVRGRIEAVGRAGHPVQMRGDRLDNVLPGIGYDILAGQWQGVTIAPESFDNRLEYVDMRSTSHGLRVDSGGGLDRRKLLLVNSWLHNSQSTVLSAEYARVDAYGVCFSEAAEAVVRLTGGIHDFSQCTIANNYLFAIPSQPLLTLLHCLPDKPQEGAEALPLMQASFDNSIIYGMASDINTPDLAGSEVYLRNVLLKANVDNDEHFIDCIGGEDPLFYTVRSDYYFNYRLRPESPAIGTGNPAYVNSLTLTDMDGLNRLADGNPALGAYVYAPPTEPEN
ncbi:MAG: hypothetical protein K2O24_02910 [Muribaculaceae bacterium]|nr:hypothetical protein [Muribaculaceae bacterium]